MADLLIDQAKQAIRQRVWAALQAKEVVDGDPTGRIPAFDGAGDAARNIAALETWSGTRVLKVMPDRAQLPVRTRALEDGKLVYMAVPDLTERHPFYMLDPTILSPPYDDAASGHGAAHAAPRLSTDLMEPVDLVVCGSVAVNRQGARIGKGAGYSDIEMALLQEAGLIGPETTIATTVHGLQIIDESLPESDHDVRVDVIATPDEIIECAPAQRPAGLLWDNLDRATIDAIPVLAALNRER